MKKEEMISFIEEVYSMPIDSIENISCIKNKFMELRSNVKDEDIESIFKFIVMGAFAQQSQIISET